MKKAQISAPFSGARTRNSCVGGSHAIHSATEVCKNLRAFFISFIILVYVPNCENRYKDHMRRCKCKLNPQIRSNSPDVASYMSKITDSSQNLLNRDRVEYTPQWWNGLRDCLVRRSRGF